MNIYEILLQLPQTFCFATLPSRQIISSSKSKCLTLIRISSKRLRKFSLEWYVFSSAFTLYGNRSNIKS